MILYKFLNKEQHHYALTNLYPQRERVIVIDFTSFHVPFVCSFVLQNLFVSCSFLIFLQILNQSKNADFEDIMHFIIFD